MHLPPTSSDPADRWDDAGRSHFDELLASLRLSEMSWVADRCRSALREAVPLIVSGLRDANVRTVFLAGSAARGEAVGWSGDERFVLSDLDIGVVTSVPPSSEVVAQLRGRLAAIRRDRVDLEVTVGIYPEATIDRQVVTPGLLDFLASACVLFGDPNWLGRFPADTPLSTWEGFRLVGNRSRELLALRAPGAGIPTPDRSSAAERGSQRDGFDANGLNSDSPREVVEALFVLAKLAEGVGTAWLIARGSYATERHVRWNRLEGDGVPIPIGSLVGTAKSFLREPSVESGRGIRLSQVRDGLSEFFGMEDPLGRPAILSAYEYDPMGRRDRLRAWRHQSPHRPRRIGWALRSRLRGTPVIRELGAAVLYWLALPENPDPDWGWTEVEDVSPDPELWKLASQLLGRRIEAGPGCKDHLRSCLGLTEESR